MLDHLLELLDSTFQEGLLLARGFVVGVLAQVAELAGGLDAGDHLGRRRVVSSSSSARRLARPSAVRWVGAIAMPTGGAARRRARVVGSALTIGRRRGVLSRTRPACRRLPCARRLSLRPPPRFGPRRRARRVKQPGPAEPLPAHREDRHVRRPGGGMAGVLVVERRGQAVGPVFPGRRDQLGIGQCAGGLDEAVDQGVFPELAFRGGRPPDPRPAEVSESLQPIAGGLRPSLAEGRLVHAGQARAN